MQRVRELLEHKGGVVYTTTPDATALAAAKAMNTHRIGALVVVDGGRLAGIVSERDLLTRVVAAERSPSATRVGQVMTPEPLTCGRDALIDEVRTMMRDHRVRHVPVLEQGELVGLVSIGDLNAAEARNLTETIGFLEAYIAG